MKKFKLTKLSSVPSAKLNTSKKTYRQAVDSGESPPVDTVVYGYGSYPCIGKCFVLFNISIEGVENHANDYMTSRVVEITENGFKTKNSEYLLKEMKNYDS